jgi:quercetin dioxygenase-like cupin family protein
LALLWNHFHSYHGAMKLSSAIEALPWQLISPGFELKVIHGGASDHDTRALLLRVAPGTRIEKHRHTGEIHALNLAGTRQILETGQVVGPGEYVYEPPGNVDSWVATGDEPAIVFLTARGALEYLDERGDVLRRSTTTSVTASYERYLTDVANTSRA